VRNIRNRELIKVKKMKGLIEKTFVAILIMSAAMPMAVRAADTEAKVTASADLVSTYYWRGQNLGGVSVQPTLGVSAGGFSFTAWGNVGFYHKDTKEFDLTASYTVDKLKLAVTDYSFDPYNSGAKYFDYSCHSATSTHVFEANVGYDFGPLSLNWYTNFAGKDYYKKSDGKRAYSTYIEAAAPFKVGEVNLKAEVGIAPWDGMYTAKTDKFAVVNIGLTASKEIKVTDSFSIPAFVKVAANPETEKAYIVFGITL
jgi:hypothetical protein